jgi:MerR family transcriptional regulator/heat shock protein HspR
MQKNKRPVYVISVAARLADMHPQTLRIYERRGLVSPSRNKKRRLYSETDIEQLKFIQKLTQEEGVNLAGVKRIIQLQQEVGKLERAAEKLNSELKQVYNQMENEIMKLHRKYSPKIEKVSLGEMVKVEVIKS